MKILITSGPTREYIDDVRYISNASSGRMGYCIAEAARRRGHKVTLISGPVGIKPARGISLIDVVSAHDMLKQTVKHFKNCDCLVMAAAVSDYMPAHKLKGKMKKVKTAMTLDLVRTPDILTEASRKRKKQQVIIGFALETDFNMDYAMDKLRKKNLDMVVLNTVRAIGADKSAAWIISVNRPPLYAGHRLQEAKYDRKTECKASLTRLNNVSKRRIADVILANAEKIFIMKNRE